MFLQQVRESGMLVCFCTVICKMPHPPLFPKKRPGGHVDSSFDIRSLLYGALLHRTFHYHPSIILI